MTCNVTQLWCHYQWGTTKQVNRNVEYLFLFPLVHKVLKSIKECRVIVQNKVARFLWPTVYMRHNNCLTRKQCAYCLLRKRISYYTCNAVCMWTQPYLYTIATAETAPAAGWLVCQTQMQTYLWLTVNSFPKSQLFAIITMLSGLTYWNHAFINKCFLIE